MDAYSVVRSEFLSVCLVCSEPTGYTNYCTLHYLEKEKNYGVYDLISNNKGFRWWGIQRIFNYYFWRLKCLLPIR
jgi:hypothetical protein